MPVEITAAETVPADAEILAVPVYADLTQPEGATTDLDAGFAARSGFEGKAGQTLALPGDGRTLLAVGVGPRDEVDADALRAAGAAVARAASKVTRVATTLPAASKDPAGAAAVAEGLTLGTYRFAGSKSSPPRHELAEAVVVGADPTALRRGAVAGRATLRARDWVNEPASQMTPTRLGEVARELGAAAGLSVEVWDVEQIAAARLGGLAGVAAGSVEEPRLIRVAWEPPGATRTLALVGKGITFDSGGLSLKTATGMMTMKDDMGGAAAVLAAVVAAAELAVGVKVVAWIAATENMPSGTATHPGDVLVARNGTSIEVLNTDAEGRLVLADALALAVEESPDLVVDVATLTGAQRVALGSGVAAVMGNDDDLVAAVVAAGARAGEPAWRLPLVPSYRKQLDSEVADLRNISTTGEAGTIIAGLFLQEFVGDARWAHLDIASPSWSETDSGWLSKGGTGWGARTLLELVCSS